MTKRTAGVLLGAAWLLLLFAFAATGRPVQAAIPAPHAQAATETITATATLTPTATPWIVTATPQPVDVFAAATAKAERTRQAETTGTATPVSRAMLVATPTVTPRVATETPTAENGATATVHVVQATALAFTTGTPYYVTPGPTNTPTATPTFIIITPTPLPTDVFEAATRQAELATQVAVEGEPTPLPRYFVVATRTPVPRVATVTPTPGNAATAVYQEAWATAVAFTTGAPPVITATPTSLPLPTATRVPPEPTATRVPPTPTPLFVYLSDLTPTPPPAGPPPFPQVLVGKILFLTESSNPRAPSVMMMDPDGSNVAMLTGRIFYDQAEVRDATSASGRYAYAERAGGANQGGLTQIWVYDPQYDSRTTWTRFGAGTAWWPAWSPDGGRIAFTSNETRNDEIYVMAEDQWSPQQLTDNEWEWDHHPTWSPDGSQIVFSSNRTGMRQLWIMNADGSNQRQMTAFPFEAWNPIWVKGAGATGVPASAPAASEAVDETMFDTPTPNPGK